MRHLFKDAVVGEVAANAARSVEESIVVVNTVGGTEIVIGDVAVVPACNVIRVGVAVVMHIALAFVDGVSQARTAPVAFFFVKACKFVVFRDANGGIAVVIAFTDKQFKVLTAIGFWAIVKMFTAQDNIVEIPITYRDRPIGSESKLNTFSDGFKVIKTILSLFRDYKPFIFFSILSSLAFIIGLIFFVPVLLEYFSTGLVPKFPTLIGSGFIFLVAILLFFVGVVLEVIVKKHRLLYELMRK